MSLAEHVYIARRFQRSVRIDTDLGNPDFLEGFICPKSSADVLLSMAQHVFETRQGAFTWTGPYGSGKSSLAVMLSALLNGDDELRQLAIRSFGEAPAAELLGKLPIKTKGWRVLGIVGRRDDPVQVIGEAIRNSELVKNPPVEWSEVRLTEVVTEIAQSSPKAYGGLIVFVDEMGKFLEATAQGQGDVYVFQQLAEAASRSCGRLIIVGVLHQSFEQYANRLSREQRDEWSKIQGRFIDLSVNTAGEEQIELLSRAIIGGQNSLLQKQLAVAVGKHIQDHRSGTSAHISDTLEQCWPLHPVTAALLGPISRRRFGQNQRSIFGFLNSAEPNGFKDFLQHAGSDDLFEPSQLWDYLRTNLEPAIMTSSDGHRWAIASEAVDRCEALGGDEIHLKMLKSIAVIDLFKDRSGMLPSQDVLQTCMHRHTGDAVQTALNQLTVWSLVIYKKFIGAYSIYAGSDFDIDKAVESVLEEHDDIDFKELRTLAGLQPVLAKRHYHKCGALRWFDVGIVPLDKLTTYVSCFAPGPGTIGQFILVLPTDGEKDDCIKARCQEAALKSDKWDTVVGLSRRSWFIIDLARELLALERVRNERTELQGDAVARREVNARISTLQTQLETELHLALDSATWFQQEHTQSKLRRDELTSLASDLADARYPKTPMIHNELLNRIKPSSNAVAARNILMRRMVENEGEHRLGIEGFPAEGGLYESILEATGLYAPSLGHKWCFTTPAVDKVDAACLAPVWQATSQYLSNCSDRAVHLSTIYDLWRSAPFGIKDGVMPILAVAYMLSTPSNIAFYRDGIFQARLKDLDVECLARDPRDVQLRWMNLSEISRRLLSGMAEIVRAIDPSNTLRDLTPIDVGRGLIAIFDKLPQWTKRTTQLSQNALHIRSVFKKSIDPNRLLFNELPALVAGGYDLGSEEGIAEIIRNVRDGLTEIVSAYGEMLQRFNDNMLAELQVPNKSSQALADLRSRAENIHQIAGEFKLDAFIGRVASFSGGAADIEGLISLTSNKPPHNWVDSDIDKATLAVTELCQIFNKAEAFARVKGRTDKRHALAVVVGIAGRPAPIFEEFNISEAERASVGELQGRLVEVITEATQHSRNVILAALTEVCAQVLKAG